MSMDINLILKSMKIFSPQETARYFRKHNLIQDATAIALRSKIDKYQHVVEYNKKHNYEYEQASINLDSARECLDRYEYECNVEFARDIVHHIMAHGATLEIMRAYFTTLLRTPITPKTSRKHVQMVQFAQIAAAEVEKMHHALLRATDPLRQNCKQ